LQDARVDVPADLEQTLRTRYMDAVAAFDPDFDRAAFLSAYADFGAQRNCRLIGLWVRLLKRDGKPGYLRHMPRTWDYLERSLAHPGLQDVKRWFDDHIPAPVRKRPIEA
jgi:N-acetylmuramate 1-kinase